MGIRARLVVVAGVFVVIASSPAGAARPARCPGGRFTVTPPPLVTGGAVTTSGALTIVEAGGALQVALGTACRPEDQVAAALTRRRRGTQLTVTWAACAGARGRVRLRGLIASEGCASFSGSLRGRGLRLRLDATRAALVCGDGLVDAGEACDPSTASSCPAGQGCVRHDEQCGCAPLCAGTNPSEEALEDAIAAAIAAHPDPFGSAEGFDRFRGAVQAALGCALNAGPAERPGPDPLPAPGGYDSSRQYCGPGDDTADWRLGLVSPDACLNQACWEHDRCTTGAGADCDGALLRACALCSGSAAGTLFSWLTPDSFVLCSTLRQLAGSETTTTTSTSTSSTQTTLPGATSSTTATTATSSSTGIVPTTTSTSSTTSTTASAVGKDLIPENIILGASQVAAGASLRVTWTVTNHGTVAVNENFCDIFWLSADQIVDAGDKHVTDECHFGIYDPGEGDTRSLDVPIPAGTPAGPAYLLIATDVQFNVAEGNEGNNVAAAAFTIQ